MLGSTWAKTLPVRPAVAAEAAAGAAAEGIAEDVVVRAFGFDAGVAFGEGIGHDDPLFHVHRAQAPELLDHGPPPGLVELRPAVVRALFDHHRKRRMLQPQGDL